MVAWKVSVELPPRDVGPMEKASRVMGMEDVMGDQSQEDLNIWNIARKQVQLEFCIQRSQYFEHLGI